MRLQGEQWYVFSVHLRFEVAQEVPGRGLEFLMWLADRVGDGDGIGALELDEAELVELPVVE